MDKKPPPNEQFNEPPPAADKPERAATVKPSFQAAPWDRTPIYRVVEVTRDANGRLRKEGRVWHTDLDRMRKFGRAVAANSASHKVLIADSAGDVLEELPVATAGGREPRWTSWQDITLPPPPAKVRRPSPRLPAPPPVPYGLGLDPFESLDVDALSTTLAQAAADNPAPAASDEALAPGEPASGAADDVEVLLP